MLRSMEDRGIDIMAALEQIEKGSNSTRYQYNREKGTSLNWTPIEIQATKL